MLPELRQQSLIDYILSNPRPKIHTAGGSSSNQTQTFNPSFTYVLIIPFHSFNPSHHKTPLCLNSCSFPSSIHIHTQINTHPPLHLLLYILPSIPSISILTLYLLTTALSSPPHTVQAQAQAQSQSKSDSTQSSPLIESTDLRHTIFFFFFFFF